MPRFDIRAATLAAGDDRRFLAFIDSQLPWLASQGSRDQWGTQAASEDASALERYRETVRRSENCPAQSLSPDWSRTYIAEVPVSASELSAEQKLLVRKGASDETYRLPVGGMILESKASSYVGSQLLAQDPGAPFIYMKTLVSDRRVGTYSKGVGVALIAHAKGVAEEMGIRRICCDCWRGNDRKLVRYYEGLGFNALADFEDEEDGWIGTVLETRF